MGSSISYHDQFIFVSNKQFERLIEFGLEVGKAGAQSTVEEGYVASLRSKAEESLRWAGLTIEKDFPSRDERKFWARVFFDVGHLIFERKLGNQEVAFWQSSASADAYILARMLTRSVQEEERGWHPTTMATLEAETWNNENFKVRF